MLHLSHKTSVHLCAPITWLAFINSMSRPHFRRCVPGQIIWNAILSYVGFLRAVWRQMFSLHSVSTVTLLFWFKICLWQQNLPGPTVFVRSDSSVFLLPNLSAPRLFCQQSLICDSLNLKRVMDGEVQNVIATKTTAHIILYLLTQKPQHRMSLTPKPQQIKGPNHFSLLAISNNNLRDSLNSC